MSERTNDGASVHVTTPESEVAQLTDASRAHEPGELGALACKLYDENPNLTEEEAYEAFIGWVESRGIELWPHQEEALMSLMVATTSFWALPQAAAKAGRAGHALHGHVLRRDIVLHGAY